MIDYYDSIKTKILQELPEIKTVRMWNNQLDRADEEVINYPAVFLSMDQENIDYRPTQGRKAQEARFVFTVRICNTNLVDNTYDDSTEWDILRLKQDVYKVLQGFKPDGGRSALNRESEEQDYNHGAIYVYLQNYRGTYQDNDANNTIVGSVSAICANGKLVIKNDLYKTAAKFPSQNSSNWVDSESWNDAENWNE